MCASSSLPSNGWIDMSLRVPLGSPFINASLSFRSLGRCSLQPRILLQPPPTLPFFSFKFFYIFFTSTKELQVPALPSTKQKTAILFVIASFSSSYQPRLIDWAPPFPSIFGKRNENIFFSFFRTFFFCVSLITLFFLVK